MRIDTLPRALPQPLEPILGPPVRFVPHIAGRRLDHDGGPCLAVGAAGTLPKTMMKPSASCAAPDNRAGPGRLQIRGTPIDREGRSVEHPLEPQAVVAMRAFKARTRALLR